jgi:hypothetical protein
MFNNMDKDEFMRMMQECHKAYLELLCEKFFGEEEEDDESPSLKDLNDEEHSYGRPMGLPESAQQPKNVNKMIPQADSGSKLPNVYLNFYMGEE